MWAVEHFSFFLLGRQFTLRTVAKGVSFILNRTREESKRALTRADGWTLRLSPYNYIVEYVRGSENIADSSSRLYHAAIHAHNAADHTVTKLPPEVVFSGRKIKRALPLLDFEKVAIDDEQMSSRDREAKLAGKEREDRRRGARPSRVKPGDTVIVEERRTTVFAAKVHGRWKQ